MTETVKCFVGNYDGKSEGLVIASSQKKAAEVARTGLHDFREYWEVIDQWPNGKFKAYTLYLRKFNSKDEWTEQP